MGYECKQIIEDETTPGAFLLAVNTAVIRMYPNGTTEDVVGDDSIYGYLYIVISILNFIMCYRNDRGNFCTSIICKDQSAQNVEIYSVYLAILSHFI